MASLRSDWLDEVAAVALRPAIDRGFRWGDGAVRRRHGRTRQGVDLQPSHKGQADFNHFFVNFWVTFDEADPHRTLARGTADWVARLHRAVPEAPPRWLLMPSTDRAAVGRAIAEFLPAALDRLDRMTNFRTAVLEFPGVLHCTWYLLPAVPSLLGDDEAVWARVREYAEPEPEPESEPTPDWDALYPPRTEPRVRHPKFGEGVVLGREGSGPAEMLEVRFADGVRKVRRGLVVAV